MSFLLPVFSEIRAYEMEAVVVGNKMTVDLNLFSRRSDTTAEITAAMSEMPISTFLHLYRKTIRLAEDMSKLD